MAGRYSVTLPTLHADQARAYRTPGRFLAIRAGRRWGKSTLCETVAASSVMKQQKIGWFAPDYKKSAEIFTDLDDMLKPLITRSSRNDGIIRTNTGGRVDFWTLDNEDAGRSRSYHGVVIDEAAFTNPNMTDIWEKAIKPTLLDYGGWCIAASNAKGIDPENFFYKICTDAQQGGKEYGFFEFHAPTRNNPHLNQAAIAKLISENPPLVYSQEYEAEFVDWSGDAFLTEDALLVNGRPVPVPTMVDTVFAVIDTAVKTGKQNDGTAVVYYAKSSFRNAPLVVLDWDIIQIEGALLETWLPTVFENLQAFAAQTQARYGTSGAFIEDKSAGEILIQQATRRSLPVTAIDSRLTALGKDERAISISGYHYRGMIKITEHAFTKTKSYKGVTRNHFLAQVVGFRVGDKNAAKRADDIVDCYCYGVALALGDSGGF